MKVGFSFDSFIGEAPDGKHQFLIRLARQMKKMGIIIDNKKPDVYLRLPREEPNKKAKINVLRVNGLIMNTRWNYKVKNRKIKESIEASDALVYQGRFCEMAYRKFLKIKNKKFAIISNGVSPKDFFPRQPRNFFLANGRWRPHKRLEIIIESFLLFLDKGFNSKLVITGKPDFKIKHSKIKYTGWQNRKQLKKLLSNAIASFHLTWLDWCPNAMVEAIIARCPVIYTKSGGHDEIASQSGIGINDTYWDWNLIDLYSPPSIDKEEVIDAMIKLKKEKIVYPINNNLDIKNIAIQYINYFETLL